MVACLEKMKDGLKGRLCCQEGLSRKDGGWSGEGEANSYVVAHPESIKEKFRWRLLEYGRTDVRTSDGLWDSRTF
jgi:hypothetical protein